MCLNLKLNNVISPVGHYQLHQVVVWDWPRLSHKTFFKKNLKHASTALLSYHKPRGNFQMTREVLEYKCNNRVIHALFFDTLAFCPACVNKMERILFWSANKQNQALNFDSTLTARNFDLTRQSFHFGHIINLLLIKLVRQFALIKMHKT